MIGGAIGWAEKIQIFLLNTIIYSGLLFALSVLLNFAVSTGFSIIKHKKHLFVRAFVLLILGAIAFALSAAAIIISVLVKGNIA
jgi:hypothetical protein